MLVVEQVKEVFVMQKKPGIEAIDNELAEDLAVRRDAKPSTKLGAFNYLV